MKDGGERKDVSHKPGCLWKIEKGGTKNWVYIGRREARLGAVECGKKKAETDIRSPLFPIKKRGRGGKGLSINNTEKTKSMRKNVKGGGNE